jgi:Flp pilus assembly protein TadG
MKLILKPPGRSSDTQRVSRGRTPGSHPFAARSRTAARSGVAVLEAAITLPLMLLLVLGTLEVGTGLRASTILSSACREAGRMVALDWRYIVEDGQTPNQKLEQDLRNLVTANGLPGDDLTVSVVHAEGASAGQTFDLADPDNDLQLVRIRVTLPYSSVSLFPVNYLNGSSIQASLVLRATFTGGSLTN